MKPKIITIVLASGLLAGSVPLFAQEYNQAYLDSMIQNKAQSLISRGTKFSLVGYTTAGIIFSKDETSFRNITFNPIFLWKPSEKIFVEAELETELEGEKTVIALEYANASFIPKCHVFVSEMRENKVPCRWRLLITCQHTVINSPN